MEQKTIEFTVTRFAKEEGEVRKNPGFFDDKLVFPSLNAAVKAANVEGWTVDQVLVSKWRTSPSEMYTYQDPERFALLCHKTE